MFSRIEKLRLLALGKGNYEIHSCVGWGKNGLPGLVGIKSRLKCQTNIAGSNTVASK